MKFYLLFSEKNKTNNISLSSESAQRVIKVNNNQRVLMFFLFVFLQKHVGGQEIIAADFVS